MQSIDPLQHDKISLITARGDYLTVNSSKEEKYTYVKNEYIDTNIQEKYYNASATITSA